MTQLEQHLSNNPLSAQNVEGFSLSFRAGMGLLSAAPLRIEGLCTIDKLELIMPNVDYPLDLSNGAHGLRHRRHILGRLDVTIFADPLEQLVKDILADHDYYALWRLSFEEGFVQVLMFDNAHHRQTPISFQMYPNGHGSGIGFTLENIIGFGPIESPLLANAAGALEAVTGVRPTGYDIQLPGILREILFHTLPGKGWRMPDESGVRLADVSFFPDRVALSFVHPDLQDSLSPASSQSDSTEQLRIETEYRITESGDRLLTENEPEKARAIYARLLDRDPASPLATARIAMLDILDADRRAQTLDILDNMSKRFPERLDLIAPLLQGAALSHDTEREIQILRHITETGTPLEQLAACTTIGQQLLNTSPKKAVAALEQALSIQREDPLAIQFLIEASAKLADHPRVARLVPRYVAAHPKGTKRAVAHVAAGHFYLMMNIADEALAHFERAELLDPHGEGPILGIAAAARQMGDTDRAIRCLGRLERLYEAQSRVTDSAEVLGKLADIWIEKGEIGLAVMQLSASLERLPDQPERRLQLARLLSQSNQTAEAARELEQLLRSKNATKTTPWFVDAALTLAELYLFELSDPDAARYWARETIVSGSDASKAQKIIERALNQSKEETIDNVANLSPRQIKQLADDLVLTGHTADALAVLETGMIEFPENVELADRLIEESRNAGDHRRLKHALSDRIDSVVSKSRRAAMSEELGQLELSVFDNAASAICCFRDALENQTSDEAKSGLDSAFEKLEEQAAELLDAGDLDAADTLFEVIHKDIKVEDPKLEQLETAEQAFELGEYQTAYQMAATLAKSRRKIRLRAAVIQAQALKERGLKKEAVSVLETVSKRLTPHDALPLHLLAIEIDPKEIQNIDQVFAALKLLIDASKHIDPPIDNAVTKLLAVTGRKKELAEYLAQTYPVFRDPKRLRRAAKLFTEIKDDSRAASLLENLYRETEAMEDLYLLVDALRKTERFDLLIGILEERQDENPNIADMLKQELAAYSAHLKRRSERSEAPLPDKNIDLSALPLDSTDVKRELLGDGGILDDDDETDLNNRLSDAFDQARKKDET